jgi:tetratricopeptide (TPR) repeat protein
LVATKSARSLAWAEWASYTWPSLDQSIEQLHKTVEMDPTFLIAHYRLGYAYSEKGLYDKAISEFTEPIKLGGRPAGMTGLAHAYALAGKRKEAEKTLDELLQFSRVCEHCVPPGPFYTMNFSPHWTCRQHKLLLAVRFY